MRRNKSGRWICLIVKRRIYFCWAIHCDSYRTPHPTVFWHHSLRNCERQFYPVSAIYFYSSPLLFLFEGWKCVRKTLASRSFANVCFMRAMEIKVYISAAADADVFFECPLFFFRDCLSFLNSSLLLPCGLLCVSVDACVHFTRRILFSSSFLRFIVNTETLVGVVWYIYSQSYS